MGCYSSSDKPEKHAGIKEEKTKEASRVDQTDQAQLDLQVQARRAKDHRLQLEKRIVSFKSEALKFKSQGNKSKAVFALKMKKLTEAGIDKVDGVIILLEQTLQQLKEAKMTSDVYSVLKKGNEAIKELQKSASLENFEEIYDDMQERQKVNAEIAEMMGGNDVEDAAYEDELDNLEKKEAESLVAKLPTAPQVKIGKGNIEKTEKVEKAEEKKREAVLA